MSSVLSLRTLGGIGYVDKDDGAVGSVTSAAPTTSSEQTAVVDGYVNLGRVSSAALMLSGVSGVVTPKRVAAALQLSPLSDRGITETRAGLGGTYAALGGWALLSRAPAAQAAVGVTWLGAAVVRMASLVVDRPRTDLAFWAYLAAEIGFGASSLAYASSASRSQAPRVAAASYVL